MKYSGIAGRLLSATVVLFNGLRFIIILGWHSSNWQSPWPFAKRRSDIEVLLLLYGPHSPDALFFHVLPGQIFCLNTLCVLGRGGEQ